MALLIPSKPPSSASPAVLRMFRLLKRLGDDFTVWHRASRTDGPQFLLLWRGRHAFLLQVAATSQQLAETALQPSLFWGEDTVTPESLGQAESRAVAAFLPDDTLAPHVVGKLVVFPNVDEATIDQVELLRSAETGVAFLGLHQTPEGHFARQLEALAAAPLSQPELVALRRSFTPEAVISGGPGRQPLLARQGTPATPEFLDFDQESLTKIDLELPPEAERAAVAAESRLITGPAGCGKSLVLLHRALLGARLHPRARLLILTHNRPINAELRRRALATAPEGGRIRWLTFFQWAGHHLRRPPGGILSARQVELELARLAAADPGLRKLQPRFLAEELGYIRDLGIADRESYLALDRDGRLAGLTTERRQAVWSLLERYRETLRASGRTDWHERALAFHDLALNSPENLGRYDFLFIDEAQFFAKVWFTPVLAALAPGGQLFLAADPTQGFLKRRQSWLAAGIDVRGRATRLAVPYRSTRAILEFAVRLLESRKAVAANAVPDDFDPPSVAELARIPIAGEPPQVIAAASPQDALTAVARTVATLREQAPWLAGNVLLLHANSRATDDLVAVLRRQLGADQVADLCDHRNPPAPAPFCAVSNFKAATGLEAAAVFLLGIDQLLAAEGDPRLDPDARAELVADHTRLLYMAVTRAARRLILACHQPATVAWLASLGARGGTGDG